VLSEGVDGDSFKIKARIGITGCFLYLIITHKYQDLCRSTKLLKDLKSNKYYKASQRDHKSISPCPTKRKQLIRAYVYYNAYGKFHTRKHMEN